MLFKKFEYLSVKYGGNIFDKLKYHWKLHWVRNIPENLEIQRNELKMQENDLALKVYKYTHWCPHCNTNLVWYGDIKYRGSVRTEKRDDGLPVAIIKCKNCNKFSIWIWGILPSPAPILYSPTSGDDRGDLIWSWYDEIPPKELFERSEWVI